MRSYFWVRENARGNVYAQSQNCGLSEDVLLSRNCSVDAENPCVETLCGTYPIKEYILKEFANRATFHEERETFINEMTRGGAIPLERSLSCALELARNAVCHQDSNAAIVASTRMLNRTLIHHRVKPILSCDMCNDRQSHKLLVSNCGVANMPCACNGLVFYHTYAWRYGARVKPVEQLTASANVEWVGFCIGRIDGDAAWDVGTNLDGYRFVGFANFSNGLCIGFPSVDSGTQERRLTSTDGVLVYRDPSCMWPVTLSGNCNAISWGCSASSCGATYFVAETSATCLGQQRHSHYLDHTFDHNNFGSQLGARLFAVYSAVRYNGELGVPHLYYASYAREHSSNFSAPAVSPSAMIGWMRENLNGEVYNADAGCHISYTCHLLRQAGKPIGEYQSPVDTDEGVLVGARLVMRTEPTSPLACAVLCSNASWQAEAGDFIPSSGVSTLGYMTHANANGSPQLNLVTVESRESVTAKLNFRKFYLQVWDGKARVKFALGATSSWRDFPSNELLSAFNEVAGQELQVFAETAMEIGWIIPAYGITGIAYFVGGVEAFSLGGIASILGYEVSESNIGEIYEVLTAGVEMIFNVNPYSSYGIVTKQIGIRSTLCDEPLCDWTKR